MADTTLPPGSASQAILRLLQALQPSNQPFGGMPYQYVSGPAAGPPAAGYPDQGPVQPTPAYDPTPFQYRPGAPAAGTVWPTLPPLPGQPQPQRPMVGGVDPISNIIAGVRNLTSALGDGSAQAETIGASDLKNNVTPFDVDGPPIPGSEEGTAPVDPNSVFVPYDVNSIPGPPTLEPPPGVDMSKVKNARLNSILGGLALGAGQVDPTEPGSFAKALAMAGGAGASAAGEAQMDMAEISQKNALAAYEAAWKNKEAEYGHQLKLHEMMAPNIKVTDDGMAFQTYNKEKGGYEVKYVDTGGLLEDAGKLKDFSEVLTGSGPVAEDTEIQYIAKQYSKDPAALHGTLLRVAIQRSVENGIGKAIFGEKYDNANTAASSNAGLSGLMNKPEEYRKEHARLVTQMLLADAELMKDQPRWLQEASNYGVRSASILSAGINGRVTN